MVSVVVLSLKVLGCAFIRFNCLVHDGANLIACDEVENNHKLFRVLSNQPRGFSAHLVRVTCQHLDPAIYQISPAVLDDRSAIIARCQFCCTVAELQNLD